MRYEIDAIENNLKRFLDQHKEILPEEEGAELKRFETPLHLALLMEKFEENDALSFGVGTIWVRDYEDIPKYLAKIRKMETS
jgi:hypothetical protein